MKKLFILAVFVSYIQAEPGWKQGTIYTYSINSQSVSTLNEHGKDYHGVITKGSLQLYTGPGPNGTFSGQLTDLHYADIHVASPNECSLPAEELNSTLNWKEINISNNTFGVIINDGVVTKVLLRKNTPTEEGNIIRAVVSQLQADLQGKNKIASQILDKDYKTDNSTIIFSTMEESITGHCETNYHISSLPENVIRSKPALAPILNSSLELNNVIDLMKTTNFSNCKQHIVYHRGMNGKKSWDAGCSNIADVLNRKAEARFIINGTFQNYTIHSSVIIDKILIAPSLYKDTKAMTVSCMNLTLVDVQKSEHPLSLFNETYTTLQYDHEYDSAENIDTTSSSIINDGGDTDGENKTRSIRHISSHNIPKNSHKNRKARDVSPSPDVFNTTDMPITGATNVPDVNTTISFNITSTTPYVENNTLETSTSTINETSDISNTDKTTIVTPPTPIIDSTTFATVNFTISNITSNSTSEITVSTPVYDLPVTNAPTTQPDTINNSNDFVNISNVSNILQLLNMPVNLQHPLLSSFSSIYTSIKNKSALQYKEIESAIKVISENIATHIFDFKSVIHENVLGSFCQLTFLISNVEYQVLHNVSNTMYQPLHGSDERKRLAWIVFRDAVVQAGTSPAIMLIKEWILYNKTTANEAEDIIGTLPKTAEIPNEQYIDALFGMVTDSRILKQESVHASLVLAFSNIIHQVFVDGHTAKALYPVHIFSPLIHNKTKLTSVYLKYLEEELGNAVKRRDSCQIHIYTKALCNVAHPEILNILKQYLKNNTQMTTFQKTFLLMSLEKMTDIYPEEVQNFLYTIYIDENEHYEVRTAAVFQIMHTKPPVNILQKIAEMTQFDSNNQVIAAVKSSIQSAAQLTNPEDEEFKENAKSVMHLLNSKNLGLQYSYQSFKSHMLEELGNLGYQHSLSYIGSENNILPKGLFINFERFLGELTAGKEYYGMTFSDVKEMHHILMNAWTEPNKAFGTHPKKQSSNEKDSIPLNKEVRNQQNSSNKFSKNGSDNHSSKYINEDQDQPEAVLLFHLANAEKFVTFGKNSSSGVKYWLQQQVKLLTTGYKFNYSKLFQRDNFFYAVPNVAGFISQFVYRVPTIYHLSGKLKLNIENSQQSSSAVKSVSQDVTLSGQLNLGYALNKHTDIGFVMPFNGNRYIVGYKQQLLINIPITVNTTASTNKQVMKTSTRFSPSANDTTGVYGQINSQIYKQFDTLSDIVKKQSATQGQIIETLSQRQVVQFAGLLLNASVPMGNEHIHVERSIFANLHTMLGISERQQSLHNMDIIFKADFPSYESSITFQTLYDNMNNDSTGWKESKSDFTTNKQKSNKSSVKGGNNTVIMEWKVLFDKDKKPKYSANLNYTWNEFSNNTKFKFSFYENAREKQNGLQPLVIFKVDGIWANVSLFNFSKAILNDPNSQFTAALLLYATKKPTITIQCNLQRTSQRKSYVLEQPEIIRCEEDMQVGNLILPSCQLASQNINYLDQHNCSIHVEDLKEMNKAYTYALNVIHMTYQKFVYYPRRNLGQQNQISFLTQFAPNFESANISILFPNIEAKFNNISVHSLLRPVVRIQPSQSAVTRTAQNLLGNQYNPICVLDKTKLNTFDNRIYPVNLGPCWYVLMALTLQSAANPKLSENDLLILVRDKNEGRAVRVMVGDDVVDITAQEIHKQTSYKYIYVNNVQYRLSNDKFVSIALNSQNDNTPLLGTIVDKNIKLHFTSVSIIFDGIRILLMSKNEYRNQTLGLCGTFTGEEHDDFMLPTHCNTIDPHQFSASYAIINNNTCTQEALKWAKIAMNKSCSLTTDIYIHSDLPKIASCHNDHNKISDPRCMTRYNEVLQEQKHTCFSLHPLPKCKRSCYPTKMVKKNINFHCVDTGVVSKQFVARVMAGKRHEFSKTQITKTITVDVPAGCYKC